MVRRPLRVIVIGLAVTAAASGWTQEALPSVAIVIKSISINCPIAPNTGATCPSAFVVGSSFRERLGAAMLNTNAYHLIERDKETLLSAEIKTRTDKGENYESALRDVGQKYHLDFYLVVNILTFEAQFSPWIWDRSTRGNAAVSASWVHVASGLTKLKPDARVDRHYRKGEPSIWLDEVVQMLASSLMNQICPVAPMLVVSLDRAGGLAAINRGSNYGLRVKQKVFIRAPKDPMGIPGQTLCDAEVTDRLGEQACMVKLKLDKKTGPQVLDKIQQLLDGNTPPEVTLQ